MGDEKLAAFNEGVVKEYISNMNSDLMRLKVKNLIITLLEKGEPSIQTVADQLHMSERNLRRKLKLEEANYRDILNEARMELAHHYLVNTLLPVTDISLRLAFTDTSNFSRAFSRYYNVSPSQYREEKKQ